LWTNNILISTKLIFYYFILLFLNNLL
jgi:hypothetical protein